MSVSSDRTPCHEFASQFGLDFFIREKHPLGLTIAIEGRVARTPIHLNDPATPVSAVSDGHG